MSRRMRQYLITMGIRMVCLAAIFVVDGWYKLIPIIGAVLLPWVAVLVANGGSDISQQERTDLLDAAPQYEVGPAPEPADDVEPAAGIIIAGEIVPEDEPGQPVDGTAPGRRP